MKKRQKTTRFLTSSLSLPSAVSSTLPAWAHADLEEARSGERLSGIYSRKVDFDHTLEGFPVPHSSVGVLRVNFSLRVR